MKHLFIIVILFFSLSSYGQNPGDLDTSFQCGWFANSEIMCIDSQPDGKIIVAGRFISFNYSKAQKIVRLNEDLSVDSTFNIEFGPDFDIYAVKVLPDGKILIGGNFTLIGEYEYHHIARLNSDGGLDLTFDIGTGFGPFTSEETYTSYVDKIILTPDNKLLLSGNFNEFNGYLHKGIVKLNYNGSRDPSFNAATTANLNRSIFLLENGKLLIANSTLERLNPDGSKDLTFTPVVVSGDTYEIFLLPDSNILIAGEITSVSGYTRYDLARLLPDGTLDFSFFPDPIASSILTIKILPDGKILAGGVNILEQFNADGTADTNFTVASFNGVVRDFITIGDKIITIGNFTLHDYLSRNRISAFNLDGSLNTEVITKGGGVTITAGEGIIKAIEVINDDIYVGGKFNAYNGSYVYNLQKLNASGIPYLDFITTANSLQTALSYINVIKGVESNKILIGGSGLGSEKLVKLNQFGVKDVSFSIGSGFSTGDIVAAIDKQLDGKYLVGGYINTYNGTSRQEVIRINSNGTYDGNLAFCCSSFAVNSIAVQQDQKILTGGTFTSVGSGYKYFTRASNLLINESEFIPSGFTGADALVMEIVESTIDTSIFIAGAFTTVNTIARNKICKLTSNGAVDFTFNPGSGANGVVNALVVLPDGRLLLGGEFTMFNGIAASRIVCLLPDGNIDASFDAGIGANGNIYDIEIYDENTVIIVGSFTSFNGATCDNLARIFYTQPACSDVTVSIDDVICEGSEYILADGTIVTDAGVYTATTVMPLLCDSIITYNLVTAPVYNIFLSAVINEGESYTLPDGTTTSMAGFYSNTLVSVVGCDSIVNVILSVVEACNYPTGINSSMITTNTAKISWSPETGATKYQIQYKPVTEPTWLKKTVTTTNKKLTGLIPGTLYQYKVKSICGAENSLFSPVYTFTTLPLKESNFQEFFCEISPNPTQGVINIFHNLTPTNGYTITIIDIQGKEVYIASSDSQILTITCDLPNGIYVVSITNGIDSLTNKLIVSK